MLAAQQARVRRLKILSLTGTHPPPPRWRRAPLVHCSGLTAALERAAGRSRKPLTIFRELLHTDDHAFHHVHTIRTTPENPFMVL